jgi:hypothetical protein
LKRVSLSLKRALPGWKIWLPIAVALLVLEAGFDAFFWEIPKIRKARDSGFSESDWGHRIALEHRRMLEPKQAGAARVLAFGSSVAGAFDPNQVQALVQAHRPSSRAEVRRLTMPGIEPSEFLLLFESEPMPPPDVTVILFNLADFVQPAARRHLNPMLLYTVPPIALWRARREQLTAEGQRELALAQLSDLYRYRRQILFGVRGHGSAGLRWLFAPEPPVSYGIHPDGYTERRFALELTGRPPVQLEYFVDPEWISQRGAVRLAFSSDGKPLAARVEREAGWKSVELPVSTTPARVEVTADGAWNPRAGGASDDVRLLGVKLKQPPVPGGGGEPHRYPIVEEGEIEPRLRIGSQRGEEADRAWDEQFEAQTHSGRLLRRARDAKLALRDQPFVADGEYLAIRALVEWFRARGSRVLLVNTPDNPRVLRGYANGTHYRDYLAFFRSLASAPGVEFHDLSAVLPSEDFNDGHHVNYVGIIKLGRRFAAMIERALPAGEEVRGP